MTAAKKRVLDAAEQLFMERGYAAVKLRDIADHLGIKTASLYNHAPGGKEELFVEVVERGLTRHAVGLEKVMAGPKTLRSQLRAAGGWLASQPPMRLGRLLHSDFPLLPEKEARRLDGMVYGCLMIPLIKKIQEAQLRAEIRPIEPHLLAGIFVNSVESLRDQRKSDAPLGRLIDETLDLLFQGALPSP